MRKFTLLSIVGCLIISGCSDQTTVFQDHLDDGVITEANSNVLLEATNFDAAGVLDIYEEGIGVGSSAKNADEAGDYPLTVVASITPPSYTQGDNLTASHVDVEGNYAYVAYNTVGADYLGGIDVVDISDPHQPRVTSRLYYTNADINAIRYRNGYVYAVGGVDAETSTRATANSFVAKIATSNGRLDINAGISYGFQEGFNATDVFVSDAEILVSSGKEGFITRYDPGTMEKLTEVYIDDARALAEDNNQLFVLDAGTGVQILDSDLNITGTIPVTSDLGFATKKTISVANGMVYVAEAGLGTGVYEQSSGSLLEYMSIPIHPDGVDTQDIVTNAVALNEDVILMANGGAGMSLAEKDSNGGDLVGILELDASVNYVESKGDYVFAASGQLGLQIIKLNRPSDSLESACLSLSAYNGSRSLTVSSGQNLAYSGAKRLNNLDIEGGSLLLCGSWTVRNNISIESAGSFELYGNLTVGSNRRRRNIVVDAGSTFRVEGTATVYGDIILNDGATLEFLGEDSVMNVFGDVEINGDVTITGNFRDVRNAFD